MREPVTITQVLGRTLRSPLTVDISCPVHGPTSEIVKPPGEHADHTEIIRRVAHASETG